MKSTIKRKCALKYNFGMSRKLPTDLEILNAIYEKYYDTFASYKDDDKNRDSKVHVPLDLIMIAEEFGVDGDIIFGRLYYHLNKKYAYQKEDGVRVSFFDKKFNKEMHRINFPLMASVLADLRDQQKKQSVATWIALSSVVISVVAIVISILSWLKPN